MIHPSSEPRVRSVQAYVRYRIPARTEEKEAAVAGSNHDELSSNSTCLGGQLTKKMIPPPPIHIKEWFAYPPRRPFVRRREYHKPQEELVTVCTQLTVDRLPRLAAMAQNYGGPISAVVYVGFRTGNVTEESERTVTAWESSVEMRRHVDLHFIEDRQRPWYALTATQKGVSAATAREGGHGSNPYPVNLLRQLSVEYAQTDYVLYLEGDMISVPSAHDLIVRRWSDLTQLAKRRRKTAFVVPSYNQNLEGKKEGGNVVVQAQRQRQPNSTSQQQQQQQQQDLLTALVPANKGELVSKLTDTKSNFVRMSKVYRTHAYLDEILDGWERVNFDYHNKNNNSNRTEEQRKNHRDGDYGGNIPKRNVFLPAKPKANAEPYFIVEKSMMPPYDVLYWGMVEDKVVQVADMIKDGFEFVIHPDLFIVHFTSDGLGDGWIPESQNWRKNWVKSFHPYWLGRVKNGKA